MDVESYKRLHFLVGRFADNQANELEFNEIHQILDAALAYIQRAQVKEVTLFDDFQLSLEDALNNQ